MEPELDYFVMDRFSIGLAPWFFYSSYNDGAGTITNATSYGFSVGGFYAFVPHPTAQKGLVVTLGGMLGFSFFPGVAGGQSSQTDLDVSLTPRLYFFLNDRLAPYIGLTPRLIYIVTYKDPTGTTVTLTGEERLYARLWVTVGIAWFIPSKKASVFSSY